MKIVLGKRGRAFGSAPGVVPIEPLQDQGGVRAQVGVVQQVTFSAVIETPENTGKVVAAEWDFEGAGDFPIQETLGKGRTSRMTLTRTYAFSKPGTYFPTLRAASQRRGDAKTPFTRIQNVGRVRVVVV